VGLGAGATLGAVAAASGVEQGRRDGERSTNQLDAVVA
jgi:hypothetical protein